MKYRLRRHMTVENAGRRKSSMLIHVFTCQRPFDMSLRIITNSISSRVPDLHPLLQVHTQEELQLLAVPISPLIQGETN